MSDKACDFKIGDSVKVNPNTHDPDLGGDISGWVGRVSEIEDQIVTIQWDSITLSQMPSSAITHCEQEGLDWSIMSLYVTEVEPTQQRDMLADVKKVMDHIQSEHRWDSLGEEGVRIQMVLTGIDPEDYWTKFEAWEKHLQNVLRFPFDAEVSEFQERGALRQWAKVKVLEITSIEDPYGVLVAISHKRSVYQFPLCDLEVESKSSPNYQPVKDYVVWFANR
ncbi:MAG: hypothetical protein KAR13_08115 [Desulfobulbaceae bacterium]|nr:hypothetical protein [Desulfobulbaceae bacterium]